MALSDLFTITINSSTRTPSGPSYGTPLLVAYHTVGGAARTLTYAAGTALSDMVTAGFAATSSAYLMAQAVLSQSPAPANIVIGRRALPNTQVVVLTVLSAVAGTYFDFLVDGNPIQRTVPGSSTTTAEATALAALINTALGAKATAVGAGANITITNAVAGTSVQYQNWAPFLSYASTTTDAGSNLAADLAAIRLENDDWYGFAIDTNSKVENTQAVVFAEANRKIFCGTSSDTACGDPASTTDLMFLMKAGQYARSYLQFAGLDNRNHAGAAMLGSRLPAQPGSDTWMYKTQVGVTPENRKSMTAGQRLAILAKNGNVYELVGGIGITSEGKSPSGEFMDIVRGRDWLQDTIQLRIFGQQLAVPKNAYTDKSVAVFEFVLKGALQDGETVGLLAPGESQTFTVPVLSVAAATRAARQYNGLSFSARYAGAIHKMNITGNVGV